MNNTETENITSGMEKPGPGIIHLNGSWEIKKRNITAAAFTALIGIGVIYFNLQSILVSVFLVIYKFIYGIELHGDLAEKIKTAAVELKTPILIALVISQYFFMLAPVLWVVKKWHSTDVKKYLRIRYYSFKEIILAVLITVSLLPTCYYLSELILKIFRLPDIIKNLGGELLTPNSGTEFIILIFVIAVTPAICEEIFFRGYFQRTLERTIGMKSFIITGIIFGLFHMQPLGLISLSLLGILFSFFYYRSKSIFPSSAAHFTNNFIAIYILYSQAKKNSHGSQVEENIPVMIVIVTLIIAAALIAAYIWMTKNREEEPFEEVTPQDIEPDGTEIIM